MLKNNTFLEKGFHFAVTHTEKIYGLISIIVFLLAYYYLGITFATRSLLFVIPIFISSIFITKYKDNLNIIQNLNIPSTQHNKSQKTNLLFLSNFLLGIISLCVLYSYESRTLGYLLILALMGSNLLLQILTTHRINNILFFIQLSFIQISLAYSLTLKYPFYYGYGDIIAHLKWIELIAQNYQISPQFGYSTYYYFPLYHIFFAMSNILTGITTKEGTFIISGLLMPITSIIVYQIAYNIVKDYKLSLITSLFFAFSREIIFYNAYMITRSFAFVLTMYIMYIIISKKQSNKQILLVLFTFSLILTHQTTVIQFSFILLVLLISFWKFNKKANNNLISYYIFFSIGYLGYWFYEAEGFITRVILSLKSETEIIIGSNSVTSVIVQSMSSLPPEIIFLLNRIDLMAVIFSISIFVYIYIVKNAFFKQLNYILIPCFVFCAFYFPNPALLFIESTHILLMYRLPLLITMFVSLISAMGLVILYKSTPKKRIGTTYCCIFFLIFSSFSIINEMNSSDNQIISSSYTMSKSYFTNEEMTSYYFLKSNSKNITVYSDEDSDVILQYYLLMDTNLLGAHFFNNPYEDVIGNNNYILLRVKEMNNRYIRLNAVQKGFGILLTKYKYDSKDGDINKISETNPNLKKKALIYNNNDIHIYL
ncbi:hypothetical protein [Methanosarcina sp. 1.H.A.2.2]|uniref:hypothetical protein n=1 Tax=Methanosarcina sp. 1.H.A.2.2 TaxID=1483601 RepID=UPI00062118F3|nr:hypothetical protein [Methanosarcina sp. 1.H.A.2.2]KKH47209.1 hypothetical protein EO93_06210 [Methanosarcina sp. 1.H.A.2.2]